MLIRIFTDVSVQNSLVTIHKSKQLSDDSSDDKLT